MARMRTLPEAFREIKAADPQSCVTLTALRRWAREGQLHTVKIGRFTVCNMDELEAFLQGG